jgi:hypothetical protein
MWIDPNYLAGQFQKLPVAWYRAAVSVYANSIYRSLLLRRLEYPNGILLMLQISRILQVDTPAWKSNGDDQ